MGILIGFIIFIFVCGIIGITAGGIFGIAQGTKERKQKKKQDL